MKPQDIIKWWPAILAIVAVIALGAETRLEVKTLKDNRDGYKRQWELIGGLRDRVTELETEMEYHDHD